MTDIDFERHDYKRSRTAYIAQCAMQYFVTLLMADTFSSKLYMHLGFSEGTTGILNSIISLAFIVQLLSIVLVKNRRIAKTLVIIFSISSHILFGCIYLTPYLPFSEQTRRALALVFVILAYSLLYFVASICYKWANSFVHPGKRGLFGAIKEMISLSGGVIFALIMAYVIGVYEKAGNLTGGFAFIAIMIFVITACDLVCLLLIKRDPPESMLDTYKKDFKKTFKYLFTNKNYVNIIILTVLYYCATYFIVGFIGSYKNALLGTVLAATIVNTVASGFRFAVSIPLGRFADKHSYAKGFELGLAISAFAYLCCVFTTDSTWYLIIGYAVLISIGLAGLDSSGINMVYNYVDLDYIEDGMALRTCIGGLFGFVAALVAGRLVDIIKANPPVIFGITIAPQQILALVSFILVIAAILFVHFVISKQRARIQ